jgi:hypothetical protein
MARRKPVKATSCVCSKSKSGVGVDKGVKSYYDCECQEETRGNTSKYRGKAYRQITKIGKSYYFKKLVVDVE